MFFEFFFKFYLEINPMEGKKLERWCDTVCARAENMLPSSWNTPSGVGLISSEELNVLTLPAHSVTMTESVSDNDSECDGKTNMILTEEEEKFAIPFQPVVSKIDKTHKTTLRHVSGFFLMKNQGGRKYDVKNHDWWKSNCVSLPGFTYIELSIQSQFNNRDL